MTHETEAACLLRTGAQYRRRVGLRPTSGPGELAFFGLKAGAASLYFGDDPIYHVDLDGRWQRAYVAGVHYLKGLDTSVAALDRAREGENLVLRRRTVPYAEAGDLDAAIRDAALDLLAGLGSGRIETVDPPAPTPPVPREELLGFLERVAAWDAAAWFAHRERYLGTYGPLPFVPPDAQPAVVLQATLGHAGGRAFGGARAAEHYVRSPEEFAEHAQTVAALLGRRTIQCRSIFLAGADVLRLPAHDVASSLEIAGRSFPIDPPARPRGPRPMAEDAPRLDGIDAFLDDFRPPLPERATWEAFRARHLRRVTLGVESGDPEVRAIYGKDWPDEAPRGVVADLKAAGLGVSVAVLVGCGGVELAEAHERATAALVGSLALGPGDLVYLIDGDEVGGDAARARLARWGLTPLPFPDRQRQQERLRAALGPLCAGKGAKVASYRLDKQWA